MLRELADKLFGVGLCLIGINIKLLADPVADDFTQRRAPVGGLPDRSRDLVEREKRRVHGVHHHHLAGQHASCDGGTARDVSLRHEPESPRSCGYRPTPGNRDRTSKYARELFVRSHTRSRGASPPTHCSRQRKECCASGSGQPRQEPTHPHDSQGLSPERTGRTPERWYFHRPWLTLLKTACRKRNSHSDPDERRKFHP